MRQDLTAFFAQNFYIHELDTNYFTASLWKTSIYSPPDLRKKVPIIYIGRVDSKRLGSGLYPDFLNILQSLSKEAGYKGVLIYLVGNRRHHRFYLRNGFSEYPEGSKTKSFLRLNSAAAEHSR
ncbi:MAG: hypothetical protein J0L93_04555 [Deltaproteobacteria bacterium]|nr:hypothetical protein [Deltaproteobacteria bacterium]